MMTSGLVPSSRLAPPELRLSTSRDGDEATVTLSGELELLTAPVLLRAVDAEIAGGTVRLMLQMGRLSFLDSRGVGVLQTAQERARSAGATLELYGLTPLARRLLDILGGPSPSEPARLGPA